MRRIYLLNLWLKCAKWAKCSYRRIESCQFGWSSGKLKRPKVLWIWISATALVTIMGEKWNYALISANIDFYLFILSKDIVNLQILPKFYWTSWINKFSNVRALSRVFRVLGSQSNQLDKKVVIIGAGPSGIAAATKLLSNGFRDITILEAEGRIGGRIHTIDFGKNVLDLGAQW